MEIITSPPGFKPFNPHEGVNIYTRRLPHWRQPGCTYFITIHLADALPAAVQQSLARRKADLLARATALQNHELEKQLRGLAREEQDHLDNLHGACWLGHPKILESAREALTFHANTSPNTANKRNKMDTWSYAIMPNHIHALVRPLDGFRLENVMGSIKGFLTGKVRAEFGAIKDVWQQESFDRIVRDAEHLRRCIQYIGNNPKKAHLQCAGRRWVHPEWRELGWGFKGYEGH